MSIPYMYYKDSFGNKINFIRSSAFTFCLNLEFNTGCTVDTRIINNNSVKQFIIDTLPIYRLDTQRFRHIKHAIRFYYESIGTESFIRSGSLNCFLPIHDKFKRIDIARRSVYNNLFIDPYISSSGILFLRTPYKTFDIINNLDANTYYRDMLRLDLTNKKSLTSNLLFFLRNEDINKYNIYVPVMEDVRDSSRIVKYTSLSHIGISDYEVEQAESYNMQFLENNHNFLRIKQSFLLER